MIYFDTSYLVRLYMDEPGATEVRDLAASDNIACALHGQAEMLAAFHRKLRERAIRPAAYSILLDQFHAHNEAGAFQWLAPGTEEFGRVNDVYATLPSNVFLRGADAIHLATAAESGFHTIYSNDRHLLAAARYFGVHGKNVIRSN